MPRGPRELKDHALKKPKKPRKKVDRSAIAKAAWRVRRKNGVLVAAYEKKLPNEPQTDMGQEDELAELTAKLMKAKAIKNWYAKKLTIQDELLSRAAKAMAIMMEPFSTGFEAQRPMSDDRD